MSGHAKGDRIGAIIGSDGKTKVVHYLGCGTYEGDEVPPKEVGGFNIGLPNPKLKLDSGDIVWGCECWWGPEDKIKEQLEGWRSQGYQIVTVSIAEARAEVQ